MKENNTVFVALGSNLGNPRKNLQAALRALKKLGQLLKKSSLYETEPVGGKKQNNFLNLALQMTTALTARELLARFQQIETNLGRIHRTLNGPREIDLDLIFYNAAIFTSKNLVLPHPRMHQRKFVLVPLSEIAPHQLHPLKKKTVAQMLAESKDQHTVRQIRSHQEFWPPGPPQK